MHFLEKAAATFGNLFICAKDLFVGATVAKAGRCSSTGSAIATTTKSQSSSSPGASLIHVSRRAALAELDEGLLARWRNSYHPSLFAEFELKGPAQPAAVGSRTQDHHGDRPCMLVRASEVSAPCLLRVDAGAWRDLSASHAQVITRSVRRKPPSDRKSVV